uniref:Uncharacterized protein n=1 Tax=Euplotes crassus TaxID=5936 RepID=A0A7S3K6S6_EUPCR|mmetsp:Transcript_12584/g.12626  ORF Transcript_12584/g.12626 Transcript_12584/m.12626 type:complete len:196 (+) Transcript_12584:3-590(+)
MELKVLSKRAVNKDQLRLSQRLRPNLRQRVIKPKRVSKRNVLSLSREHESLKLSMKLRKFARCKNKIKNVEDFRNVIKSLVSPRRKAKPTMSPSINFQKIQKRRVLSAERLRADASEKQRQMESSMTEFHQKMIYRISRKLEQSKIVNGRFCSPVVLRQKATDFQSNRGSSKSISDASNFSGSVLPEINKGNLNF